MMPSKLAGLWKVFFAAGSFQDQEGHSFFDGDIQLWANNWMVLRTHLGSVVVGRYLQKDEQILVGKVISFPSHFARVLRVDLLLSEVCPSENSTPNPNWIWRVSYSTFKDLDRGRMKSYDGSMHLLSAEKWLILKNAKGNPIAVQAVPSDRVLQAGEFFTTGSKVKFQAHSVRIGKCLQSPPQVNSHDHPSGSVSLPESDKETSSENALVISTAVNSAKENSDSTTISDISSAVHESISMGLDFSVGQKFAKLVRRKFFSSVHPSADSGHFTMVVSLGRAAFRLSEESVGIALEAAIGGYCGSLKVSYVANRVYSFVVSSKPVGFEILSHRSYSCKQFKCYFHLWGRGGPNWELEFNLWQRECNMEWTLVSPSKRRVQLGLNAMKGPRPKSAIKSTDSSGKKISFAQKLDYEACKGYTAKEDLQISDQPFRTVTQPCISFGTAGNFPLPHHSVSTEVQQSQSLEGSGINSLSEGNEIPQDDDFANLVNDLAFRFWKCSKCLSMDHTIEVCMNKIHCRACYRYGHIEKNCFSKSAAKSGKWIPKRTQGKVSNSSQTNIPLAVSTSAPVIKDIPLPMLSTIQGTNPPLFLPSPLPPTPPPPDLVKDCHPMVVFELDPTPWLPWGHQVIDGGATRLPRSYYNPANDPPQLHQDWCIAVIEPAPPAMHNGLWRDRVRNFLAGPLNRQVLDYQPSTFGLGMFQHNSPNSREALVQHGAFQLDNHRMVRFINVNEAPENVRAVQGYRTGWLMFLGIPPDYRNDYDIANVVSTFEKFLTWTSTDPYKCR
jgi:hypothetical protein